MKAIESASMRRRVEEYAKKKYHHEPEQLPFGHEDYAVLRHSENGKWYAVFIVKQRYQFGLDGDGDAEIMSVKIKDRLLADLLTQQPGFLWGFPSRNWNWTSMLLDGTAPSKAITVSPKLSNSSSFIESARSDGMEPQFFAAADQSPPLSSALRKAISPSLSGREDFSGAGSGAGVSA